MFIQFGRYPFAAAVLGSTSGSLETPCQITLLFSVFHLMFLYLKCHRNVPIIIPHEKNTVNTSGFLKFSAENRSFFIDFAKNR